MSGLLPIAALAVDPASKKPHAFVMMIPGLRGIEIVDYGLVAPDDRLRRDQLVRATISLAEDRHLIPMLGIETWKVTPTLPPAAFAGLQMAAGQWRDSWTSTGQPRKRVVRPLPHVWRGDVLQHGNGDSDFMKELASTYVEARYRLKVETADEAEAICIGTWMMTAPAVQRLLPKRALFAKKGAID